MWLTNGQVDARRICESRACDWGRGLKYTDWFTKHRRGRPSWFLTPCSSKSSTQNQVNALLASATLARWRSKGRLRTESSQLIKQRRLLKNFEIHFQGTSQHSLITLIYYHYGQFVLQPLSLDICSSELDDYHQRDKGLKQSCSSEKARLKTRIKVQLNIWIILSQ